MKYAAIPTLYKGIRFRSRLEARWAALFDLAGWRWDYEPFDLAGWIPDFIIHAHRPILVEVKPIIWRPSSNRHAIDTSPILESADLKKVRENVPLSRVDDQYEEELAEHSVLVLGANFIGDRDGTYIGAFLEKFEEDSDGSCFNVDPARICDGEDYRLDLNVTFGGWYSRVGNVTRSHKTLYMDLDEAQPYWATAGNIVQWRGASL